jgi:hypothetical protein
MSRGRVFGVTAVRGGIALWCAVLLLVWPSGLSSHNPITTTVLFNRDIAPILNQKCGQCHVADGMAMPLRTYSEVRPWAVAIKEEVLGRRMPPWSAEHDYGAFANDVSLTPRERDFLISWIDGGVPEGPGEPPAHADHSSHWMLGPPDQIAVATTDRNSASLQPGFTRYVVDPRLKRDAWLRAFDFKPDDKRTARAAFLTIAATGEYIGGWTPWSPWFSSASAFPDGTAFRLPAGSRIAIDVLTATTPPPSATPQLGLYFATGAPQRVTNLVVTATESPTDGRVRGELRVNADTTLLGLRVDLSDGGRSLELKTMRPDGSFEHLLWVREFRRDWAIPYVFRSPVSLPRGSVIVASALFDAEAVRPYVGVTLSAVAP